MEYEDERICLNSFPQVYKQMVVVMIQQMMARMAQEGVGIGMAPTTARPTSQREDAMCAATWWKPLLNRQVHLLFFSHIRGPHWK